MTDATKLLLAVATRALLGGAPEPPTAPVEWAFETTGQAALETRISTQRRTLLAPPPRLSVSEWADQYRVVPSYSADAGPWITDRTPYLREIMDSFSDPGVNRVVFKKCARIGATEAGLNIIGYFVHQDPSAIMIVQPTVDDAKDFSKEQLAPTIAETPVLAERVASGVKESSNTITAKTFPGGSIVLGGANSPRFFRRRTVRVVVLEEVNGYSGSSSAKGEGDQIKLAEKRAETLTYRRKIYINSTPTNKGDCRISKEFASGDQRYRFVPCPSCAHMQRLVWEQLKYKDLPEPAYECERCHYHITSAEKDAVLARGEWRAMRPEVKETRSYSINALYSPFVTWARLVEEWVAAQGDKEALQVFVNTALGEEWEDREIKDLQDAVQARAKPYEPEGAPWRVPRNACILVCGVDKQPQELHAVVRAFGPGEESWLIETALFRGDTSRPQVWGELEKWRKEKTWLHESGVRLPIRAMCVDSGDDPDPVYSYTKPLLADYVFAVKGASDPTADILPKKFTRTRLGSRLYLIGTQAVKKRLFNRVGLPAPVPYDPIAAGPTFLHFNAFANARYFAEFFSQKMIRTSYRGKSVAYYVARSTSDREEILDCEVYAYVALQLGPVRKDDLASELQRIHAEGAALQHPTEPTTAAPPPPAPESSGWLAGVRRSGWMR